VGWCHPRGKWQVGRVVIAKFEAAICHSSDATFAWSHAIELSVYFFI